MWHVEAEVLTDISDINDINVNTERSTLRRVVSLLGPGTGTLRRGLSFFVNVSLMSVSVSSVSATARSTSRRVSAASC